MTDIDQVKSKLAEAELAYHQLMIGQSGRVYVDQSGERMEFTPANAERLRSYIMTLKAQLGQAVGSPPMGFFL